ncbi:MAG: 3-phosphoshikimate 1-carboxyvinyltransferase [bacterium]
MTVLKHECQSSGAGSAAPSRALGATAASPSVLARMIVRPGAPVRGTILAPGDKSLSHRISLLASLCEGVSQVHGFLRSDDTGIILEALTALGASYSWRGEVLTIRGGRWRAPERALDLGNSGTGMRLLAGLLAGQPFATTLTGDRSLSSRPMRRIAEPLLRMGAKVELTEPAGTAPLRIAGGALRGIEYRTPVASAQVKSCVLLAGLFAEGRTRLIEPAPTRDHTERVLRALGVAVRSEGTLIELDGCGPAGPRLAARDWTVPRDFSSAAFWIAMAAAWPGARMTLPGIGINPRRAALLGVLTRMGAQLRVTPEPDDGCGEPVATIQVDGALLHGTEVGGAEIPDLIDELPLVAVLGALAQGRTTIRDAAELRVKESDRIASVVDNLRRFGAEAEANADGLTVEGPLTPLGGVTISSYGDHRLPMAMSLLALRAAGPVEFEDVGCMAKSYPEFWRDLREVGGNAG